MVGDEKNGAIGIERTADMNPDAEEAAHEFVITVRESFCLPKTKFQEPVLNEHQRQRYRNKGGEKHRSPQASEKLHHSPMKYESIHPWPESNRLF